MKSQGCPVRKHHLQLCLPWYRWEVLHQRHHLFHQMQRQRKFIQTIHVRVEVVKNIKNAVAESKKGQALKYEVIDRASR